MWETTSRNLRWAARGSSARVEALWVAVVGGVSGGLIFLLNDWRFPVFILDNPFWDETAKIVACASVGVVITFIVRFAYSWLHFPVEARGGWRVVIRKNLRDQMWPILLMLAGLGAFVVLFGAGAIWYVATATRQPSASPAAAVPIPMQSWSPSVIYDVPHELALIDSATPLIRNDLSALITRGLRLGEEWVVAKGTPSGRSAYVDKLKAYAGDVDALRKKLYRIKADCEQYGELYPLLQPIFENQIFSYALEFARNVEKMSGMSDDAITIVGNDNVKQFENAVRDSTRWRDETIVSLLAVRKNVASLTISFPVASPPPPAPPK